MTRTTPFYEDRPVAELRRAVKRYGAVTALAGMDFEVRPGEVVALLGPNGAGKTTTVRVLTTLLKPDEGTASVAGLDVVKDAHALRERIGLAGQYAAIDDNLTGIENLVMVGRLYGMKRKAARARALELLERFDLTEAGDRIAKTYSGGMGRRLDLAASIVAQPPVLFLDEPTTGLDPRSRIELWATIEDLVGGGTTVLLTTQYLDEADRLADRIAVVDGGKVIAEGTSDELKSRVGGDRVEVTLVDEADAPAAASALVGLCQDAPQIDGNIVRVTVDSRGGAVMDAARLLDRTNATVEDIAVRRPTLDDVFLTLTGHTAEEAAEDVDPQLQADDKVEVAA
jgi:ABC-2 type transport system ATP-binding protein